MSCPRHSRFALPEYKLWSSSLCISPFYCYFIPLWSEYSP
jgi:hypothetical protein